MLRHPAMRQFTASVSPRSWVIILLSGLAGMLFYIDRQALSVLKTTLKDDWGMSDVNYSWLVAAYMIPYTIFYLISGRLIDRWGTRLMMPIFLAGMALSTVGSGLAVGLWSFGATRVLLGLAEAGIIPAVMVAIVAWFPVSLRGTATTLNKPLTVAGPILVVPFAAWISAHYGWRWAFIVPGVLSGAVAVAWWFTDHGAPAEAGFGAPRELPSFRAVLARKDIRGVLLARILTDPLWFFLMFWQPGFLQEELGMSLGEFGRLGWIPAATSLLGIMALGLTSDVLVRRGVAPARSRVRILIYAATLSPALLALTWTHSIPVSLVLLSLVQVMAASWLSFSAVLLSDLVPPRMVGTTVAVMSALGATSGLLLNLAAGPLIQAFGYNHVLAAGSLLHPLAALILWRAYLRPTVPSVPPRAMVETS